MSFFPLLRAAIRVAAVKAAGAECIAQVCSVLCTLRPHGSAFGVPQLAQTQHFCSRFLICPMCTLEALCGLLGGVRQGPWWPPAPLESGSGSQLGAEGEGVPEGGEERGQGGVRNSAGRLWVHFLGSGRDQCG